MRTSKCQSLDVWKEPSCATCPVDVCLTPHERDDVIFALKADGFNVKTMIADVQRLLDVQKTLHYRQSTSFDYSRYHTLDEVELHKCQKWHKNNVSSHKQRTCRKRNQFLSITNHVGN